MKKIYGFRIESCRIFSLEELTWKDGKKIQKTEEEAFLMDNYEDRFNEIDSIGVARKDYGCKKGTKKYYDFISLDLFYITANQKALDFLDKHNINYWKLEKPVKIVNDKDVKEKYYLIMFPKKDLIDVDASELYWNDDQKAYRKKGGDSIDILYFKDDSVNLSGISKVKHSGYYLCNAKTKTLLEESGLSGFEFEKQLLASEKPKEKTFVDKLLGK